MSASNTPIIRRRTLADRARYLEERVDKLLLEVDDEKFQTKAIVLLSVLSLALHDFAKELPDD